MNYGICTMAAMPLRKENLHASEMVSQLLYNETYETTDNDGDWIRIRTTFDHYEGWIPAIQHHEIDTSAFEAMQHTKYVVGQAVATCNGKPLSFGTPLLNADECAVAIPECFNPDLMVRYAQMLLGSPYLWGGRTVFGIDCSGFAQLCARASGATLPRDASQQVKCGELVYFLPETRPGDLAFFGKDNGTITHVGIMMDSEHIIHASGQVRIDGIDQSGIFNKDRNLHTHQLIAIKRISTQ